MPRPALIGGIAATSAKLTESLGALTDDLRELARLQRYEIRADRRWHLAPDDLHREVFGGTSISKMSPFESIDSRHASGRDGFLTRPCGLIVVSARRAMVTPPAPKIIPLTEVKIF